VCDKTSSPPLSNRFSIEVRICEFLFLPLYLGAVIDNLGVHSLVPSAHLLHLCLPYYLPRNTRIPLPQERHSSGRARVKVYDPLCEEDSGVYCLLFLLQYSHDALSGEKTGFLFNTSVPFFVPAFFPPCLVMDFLLLTANNASSNSRGPQIVVFRDIRVCKKCNSFDHFSRLFSPPIPRTALQPFPLLSFVCDTEKIPPRRCMRNCITLFFPPPVSRSHYRDPFSLSLRTPPELSRLFLAEHIPGMSSDPYFCFFSLYDSQHVHR